MSIFNEFDSLRSAVNRMMGDFDTGLRGGRGVGGGFGGGWPQSSLIAPSFGGGFGGWDEDILDMPLLTATSNWMQPTSMFGRGATQGRDLLKGSDEIKMEDVGQQPQQQQQAGGTQLATRPTGGALTQTFRPDQFLRARVNVEDQKDKFIVTADVPGFDKKNIHVNVSDDGLLHIKAEQKQEHIDEAKDKTYLRAERSFANFRRTLRLPRGVDQAKISANYENGVLHVNLPKTEEALKAKQDIQIQ